MKTLRGKWPKIRKMRILLHRACKSEKIARWKRDLANGGGWLLHALVFAFGALSVVLLDVAASSLASLAQADKVGGRVAQVPFQIKLRSQVHSNKISSSS